ncbi:MAG TPA: polysaccharide deacetylase family protein [Pirellulales bacterium]|nr:polysaccharide deacetylase family protein [Pirellulales bacterium]
MSDPRTTTPTRPNLAGRLARRDFLRASAAAVLGGAALARRGAANQSQPGTALVAITLDLEMSRNFPRWEDTHWDYEKGNLNDESKAYTVEACRRIKAAGAVAHLFAVGRVCEQENLDWLRQLAADGHHVGNHTYDHVNVLATHPEDVQFRFKRAPWLVAGRSVEQTIADNIRLTTVALRERTGIAVDGFRTPGGFANGLADRPDIQEMLQAQGFDWVSSKYPAHPNSEPGIEPSEVVLAGIVAAQTAAQPFIYESGLCEIPMSPASDINAFRSGRWKLDWFLESVRRGLGWAIANRAVYDFLGHPSCLYVADPDFRTIDLICQTVGKAKDAAKIVDLGTIARATRAKVAAEKAR